MTDAGHRFSWRRWVQIAAFALFIRPAAFLLLGLRAINRQALPAKGPAIIVANHNSHLDSLILMALMPLRLLSKVRPVAAADHFSDGFLGFLARIFLRIIPISRQGEGAAVVLAPVVEALGNGDIILFFPEGSRGDPDVMLPFRRGIGHLATAVPKCPITPVYLHGTGKCLPKASVIFVPFTCTAVIGAPFVFFLRDDRDVPATLEREIRQLGARFTVPEREKPASDSPRAR